ncbi:hypothetical protein FNF31_03096 [Cafeteria roenbergensis]|uniref:Uncharacterized protein n=1 Tax=Cafeteria roenbergensis TaxID=33653 RepID=A0A5A8DB74_CAFRO|nr:hypothetical protein FNF31_03096 [Cafeteria roenbergensis]
MPPSARAHPGSASTAAASSGQAAASRRSALGSILKARVLQATSDSEVIAGVLTAQGHAWAGKGPPRKGGEYAMARRLSHDTLASQNSDKGPASSADGPAAGGSDPHRADGASRPDRLRVDGAGSSNGLDMPGAVLRGQSDGSAGLFMPSSSAGAVEASSDGQGADAHPRHSIRFAELHPIAGAIAEELASALTAVMGNVLQAARVIAREDGSDILSAHHIATAVEQKPTLQKLFGTGWRMSLSARVGPIVAAVRVAALPTLRLARGGVVRKGVVRQGTLLRLYRDMYAVRERLEAGPPAAEGAALRQVLAALLKVAATAERHALGETVEEYAVGWGRWVGPSWGDGSYAGALTAVPQAGGAGGAAPAAAPGGGIWAQTRAQMPAPPMLSQSRVFGPAPAPARDVFADAFAAAGSSEDRSPASSSRRGRAPPSSGSMSGAAHSNPKPKDHVLVGGEDTAWQYGAWRLARRACVIRDSFFAPDVAPALAEALFVQTEAALASAASMMELEVAAAASSAMVLAASRQRLAVTAAAEQLAEADCKAATTAATAAAAATGAPDDAAAKAGAAAAPARGDPAAPQAPPRSHRRAGSGPSSGIASVAALSAKVGAPVGSADGRDSVAARSPRAATARLSDIGRSPVVGASKLGASQSDGASSFSGGPTPPSQPVADPASSAVAAPEPALPFPEPAAGAAALSPAVGASVAGGADAPSAETPEASTIRGATRPPAGSITEESDVGIGRRARRPSVQLAKAGTPERVVNSPMLSARASREPAGSTPGQLAARQGDGTKGATDGGNWGSFGRERSGSQVAGVFGEDVLSEAALEMMPDLGMGDGSPRTPSDAMALRGSSGSSRFDAVGLPGIPGPAAPPATALASPASMDRRTRAMSSSVDDGPSLALAADGANLRTGNLRHLGLSASPGWRAGAGGHTAYAAAAHAALGVLSAGDAATAARISSIFGASGAAGGGVGAGGSGGGAGTEYSLVAAGAGHSGTSPSGPHLPPPALSQTPLSSLTLTAEPFRRDRDAGGVVFPASGPAAAERSAARDDMASLWTLAAEVPAPCPASFGASSASESESNGSADSLQDMLKGRRTGAAEWIEDLGQEDTGAGVAAAEQEAGGASAAPHGVPPSREQRTDSGLDWTESPGAAAQRPFVARSRSAGKARAPLSSDNLMSVGRSRSSRRPGAPSSVSKPVSLHGGSRSNGFGSATSLASTVRTSAFERLQLAASLLEGEEEEAEAPDLFPWQGPQGETLAQASARARALGAFTGNAASSSSSSHSSAGSAKLSSGSSSAAPSCMSTPATGLVASGLPSRTRLAPPALGSDGPVASAPSTGGAWKWEHATALGAQWRTGAKRECPSGRHSHKSSQDSVDSATTPFTGPGAVSSSTGLQLVGPASDDAPVSPRVGAASGTRTSPLGQARDAGAGLRHHARSVTTQAAPAGKVARFSGGGPGSPSPGKPVGHAATPDAGRSQRRSRRLSDTAFDSSSSPPSHVAVELPSQTHTTDLSSTDDALSPVDPAGYSMSACATPALGTESTPFDTGVTTLWARVLPPLAPFQVSHRLPPGYDSRLVARSPTSPDYDDSDEHDGEADGADDAAERERPVRRNDESIGAVDVSAVLGTLIPGASAAVGGSDGLLPSGSDGSGRSGLDALVNGPGAHGPHFGPAGRQRAGGGRANPADDAPTIGRALAAGRHEEPPALGRTGSTSDLQRAVPARRGSAVGAPRKSSRLAQTGPYGIAKPAAPAGPVAPAADGDSASGRSSSGGVGGSLSHAPASADPGDGATSPIQGVGGSQPGTVFRHNAHRAVGRTDWRVHTSQPHTVGSRRTDASGQASGAAESVLSSSPHAARLGPGRARASTADSGLGVSDPFASRSAGPATSVRRHVQGGGAADPAAACGPAPSPAPSPQSGQAADQPGRDGEQDAAGSAGSFVRRGSQGDRTATASHVTTDASTGQSSGGGSVVRGRNDSEDLGSRALRGSLLALGSTVDASSASTATAADDADDGVVRAGALPASDFGKRPSKAGRAASDAGSTGSGSSNSRGTDHVPQVPQLTGTWTHNAGDSGGHVVGSAQSRAGGQVVSILKRVVSTGREEEERAEEVSRQAALELLDGDHDVLDTRDEDDMLDDDEAGGSVNGSAGTASTMEQAGAMQSLYAAADQRSPLGIDAELPSGSQAASSRSESPGASDHFEERSRSSGSRSGSHIAMSASALGLSEADDLRAGVRETRHSSGSGNSLLDALGGVEFSSRARHVPAALAGSSQHPALPAPHGRRGSAGSSGSDGPLYGRRRGPRIQPSGSQTTKARRSGNALVDRLGGRPGSGAGRVGAARDKARSMVAAGAAPGIAVSAAARRQGLLGQPDARVAHSLGQVPAGLMRGTRAVGSPGVLQPAGLSAGLVAELSAGSDLAPAGPGTAGAESSGMSLSSEETRRTQSQFQSGPGGGGAKPGLGSAPLSIRVSGPKREVTLAASSPEPQLHRRRLLASQEVPRLVRANSRDSEAASDGGGDVVSEAVDAVMQEVGKSPRHRRHSVGEMASPRAGPSASPRGVASATASAGLRIGGQPAVSAAVRASRAGLGGVDSPLRTATSGPASSLGRPSAGEGSEGNSVGSLALTPAFAGAGRRQQPRSSLALSAGSSTGNLVGLGTSGARLSRTRGSMSSAGGGGGGGATPMTPLIGVSLLPSTPVPGPFTPLSAMSTPAANDMGATPSADSGSVGPDDAGGMPTMRLERSAKQLPGVRQAASPPFGAASTSPSRARGHDASDQRPSQPLALSSFPTGARGARHHARSSGTAASGSPPRPVFGLPPPQSASLAQVGPRAGAAVSALAHQTSAALSVLEEGDSPSPNGGDASVTSPLWRLVTQSQRQQDSASERDGDGQSSPRPQGSPQGKPASSPRLQASAAGDSPEARPAGAKSQTPPASVLGRAGPAAPASASGRGGQPAHGISPGTSEAGTTYSEARPVGVGNLGLYDATLRTSGSMAQRALGASGVTVGSKAADPSFGGVVLAAGGPVTGVSAAPSPATEVPGTTGGLFFPGITVQTDASPRDRDAADRVGSHGIAVASPSRRGTTHMRGRVGLPLDSPSQGDLIGFPAGSNADGTWPGSIAGGDQIEDSPRRSMHTQLSGGDETSSGILTDSATLGPAAGASSRAAAGLEAHSEISDDPTPSGLQRSDSATSEFAQPLPRGLESLAPLEVLDEPVRLAAKYLRGVVCSALRLPDWASLREAGTQAPPVSMSERNRVVKTGLISSGAQGTSKDVNADDAEWTPWEQAMAQLSFRSLRVAQRLSAARSVVAASESGLCYSKALFAARISRPIAALLGLSASRRATGVLQTAAEAEATTLLKLAIKLPVHAMSQGAWRITGGDLRLVMALRWPATLGARAALRSSLRAELLNLRRIVAGGTTVPSSDCLELYDPASHATRLEWAGSAGGQAGRRSEALRKAVAKANEAGADLPAISSLTPISRWSKAPDVVRVEALDSWEAQPGPWPAIIGHSASAGAVVVMQVASSAGSAEHKAELASLAWERGHLVFSSATYGGGKAATRVAQQNGSEQPGNAQVAVAVPGV